MLVAELRRYSWVSNDVFFKIQFAYKIRKNLNLNENPNRPISFKPGTISICSVSKFDSKFTSVIFFVVVLNRAVNALCIRYVIGFINECGQNNRIELFPYELLRWEWAWEQTLYVIIIGLKFLLHCRCVYVSEYVWLFEFQATRK